MASTQDPLVLLRQSITAGKPFVPSTSSDPSAPVDDSTPLSKATHLQFPADDGTGVALPLDAPTRFNTAADRAVDLRSIYFAWLNRELAIPEYNAAATTLNGELGDGAKVQNLGFIERLDLITWLEGASDDSEYIKPIAGDADATAVAATAAASGAAAVGAASKTGAASAATQARSGKGTMDPRLASIYSGERRMGDRNTVLRGIKPTVSLLSRSSLWPYILTYTRTSHMFESSRHPSSRSLLHRLCPVASHCH
jgi:parafibromin